MPRLTKRFVDALTADAAVADRVIWDDSLSGFGVRVRPTGGMTWIAMYRTHDGRQRKYRIGKVGALTPDEARTQARAILAAADRGADPAGEKTSLRKAITVAELCELFLDDEKGRIKPSTFKTDRSRIDCHVIPLLGRRKVVNLKMQDIEDLQIAIADGRSRQPRRTNGRGDHASGGKGVAARTITMVGTMLEFARRRGIVETNVARGVKKFSVRKRNRRLSHEEYVALGQAMRRARELGENRTALDAITALALTGCRRMEILSLPWDWIDARAHVIRFGDTKTGAQIRPLGRAALEFFLSLPSRTQSRWVFPAMTGEGHFVGAPHVLQRICKEAGLNDVTLHTLRHSFASVAAELGYSDLTIAGLLGHRLSSITARYSHIGDRALVYAADTVAEAIQKALEGTTGEIVPFSAARLTAL